MNPFIPILTAVMVLNTVQTVKADELTNMTPAVEIQALKEPTTTMYCNTDGAGVYPLPDDRIEPVDTANENTTFEVIRTGDTWSMIVTCDGVAYMKTKSLSAEPVSHWRSMGTFRITHYCPCNACGTGTGLTASGRKAQLGRTVAMNKKDAPIGAHVLINGKEYVVEDRGVKPGVVDIFVSSHKEALRLGTYKAEVFVLSE